METKVFCKQNKHAADKQASSVISMKISINNPWHLSDILNDPVGQGIPVTAAAAACASPLTLRTRRHNDDQADQK